MALPANYVDDIFSGTRKYQMVQNSDGTISLIDQTSYLQEGSTIGASDFNAIIRTINRINSAITFTLQASKWTKVGNSYVQTVRPTLPNEEQYDENASPLWYLNASATDDLLEAISYIGSCEETSNGFTFTCGSDKPEIDVPIKVKGY